MIKDSVFNDEKSFLNSIYMFRKGFEKFIRDSSGELNINPAEAMFLSEIYYNEGTSQREISKNLFVSEANIAKTFKKLEEKGLVYKNVDETNNTRRQLHLTQKGKEFFETTIDLYNEFKKYLLNDLDDETIEKSRNALAIIAKKSIEFSH